MTHDNKYLLVADQGMDHVNVYRFDVKRGTVKLVDVIRSELESAPRHIKISKDGQYVYIVHEWKCYIDVYRYEERNGNPWFEKIQTIATIADSDNLANNAASALSFSDDYKYLVSSNAGDNTVVLFDVDMENGLLTKNFCLPVSGDYPKDAELFPGGKFLVSLNHETNNMTFFKVDTKNHTIIMNGPEIKINQPNCIVFYRLDN